MGGRNENNVSALDADKEMARRLGRIREIDGLTLKLIEKCSDW